MLDLKNSSSNLGSGKKGRQRTSEICHFGRREKLVFFSLFSCVIFYFLRYVLYKVIVILSVLILGFILKLSTKTVPVSVGNEPARVT